MAILLILSTASADVTVAPFDSETNPMNPVGLFLVAAGIFSICGAAFDWDWFINSRKAAIFVAIFGRNGARIFYGILGAALAVMGTLITVGILKNAT